LEQPVTPPPSLIFDGPRSADTVVVLGHGAGAGKESPFMTTVAHGIAGEDLLVCRFDFPYAQEGRKSPDRQPILEESYRAAVDEVHKAGPGRLVVLGGKSLGGRIASHIVARGTPAAGLVFLGYPLHPPGRPDRLRISHLKDIEVPMLFVEGTRDPFCPLGTLEAVLKDLRAPTEVAVIEDGDHSLKVRSSSGRTTSAAWQGAVTAVRRWLRGLGE
jgi:uncharacterized protein